MKGLKNISQISSFYKFSIIVFTAVFFLAVLPGCDMLAPEAGQNKIDIADASEPKGIAPAEETTPIEQETTDTQETIQEEQLVEREITVKAYYSDEMAESVIGEDRAIIGTTNDDFIFAAFQEIIKEPIDPGLYNLMPEGTQIISAAYNEGIAVINLSSEFVDNKGSQLADTLLLACIVNTLTEIENIDGVLFEIEGEKLSVYGNHDTSVPMRRNYSLIKGN